MSTLLVRSIAHSFRRAGIAFSSAATTRLDPGALSYDQARAIVFEPQLQVSAEVDREGSEPVQLSAEDLRNAFLVPEREMGVERAREVYAEQQSHLVDAIATVVVAVAAANAQAESPPPIVPVPSRIAEPSPVAGEPPRAPAKPKGAKK